MYYSPTTGGFYNAAVNGENIPEDATEITSDEYFDLLAAQSQGFEIRSDQDGRPVAMPPSPPTTEQLAVAVLMKRDDLLRAAAIRIAPLQDAVDLDDATPEEAAQLTAWKRYRVALNRIEQQPGFPSSIDWPTL